MDLVWENIQPREGTQAKAFSSQLSSGGKPFDGTGITVAILDTGVDPGAVNLRVCPDGRPKIVDVIDCTGAGDVNTSTVVEPISSDENGSLVLQGLSGRKLRVPSSAVNPSNIWRVGVKRMYELFPRPLINRVTKHRKEKWQVAQHQAEVELKRREAEAKTGEEKKELTEQLSLLQTYSHEKADPGPVIDLVVWNDGTDDWVYVYSDEATVKENEEEKQGEHAEAVDVHDLSQVKPLRSFRIAQEYSTFSVVDSMNFCVRVHEDGKVVNLCCDTGTHGTHVAGIVAAYDPNDSAHCGVAPGAQIVSLKIGDTRLGSMETGVGLHRALLEAQRLNVDMINMSYGEATLQDNVGSFIDLARELVEKHGIVFVASAGNNGPALTTVGCPGGTSSPIIGVAAAVSGPMMDVQYSLTKQPSLSTPYSNERGITYTWSSVGPSMDGDFGVNMTAPGAAISPVPTWTLQRAQLMNGTSMSSPNCCGCIALVLSAMKHEGGGKIGATVSKLEQYGDIPFSVARVRRAVENTCLALEGVHPLSQGRGMVQVSDAFDYVLRFKEDSTQDVIFNVSVGASQRGVYLRQAHETSIVSTHAVSITLNFPRHYTNAQKSDFHLHLNLKAGEEWVSCPEHLLLVNNGRGFSVTVDPTNLEAGRVYHTNIGAFRENTADPLFQVPITVVKPEAVSSSEVSFTHVCEPGLVHRRFLTPPVGSTFCEVTLTDARDCTVDDGATRLIVLHCLQLLPSTPYRDQELHRAVRMRPGEKQVFTMALESLQCVEFTLAQFWSSPGASDVIMSIRFRGVRVEPSSITITTNGGSERGSGFGGEVRLTAELKEEMIEPKASLKTLRTPLTPTGTPVISPLGETDVTPAGRQSFQLVLQYEYKCDEAKEITPRAPLLNGILYESPLESQFIMVFDSKKKFIGSADAWPDAVKLPTKGTFTLRLQIRHTDLSALEKLKSMVLWVESNLKAPVELQVFRNHRAALAGEKPLGSSTLLKGHAASLFIAEPSPDKLPPSIKPGDVLIGTLAAVKKVHDVAHPRGWPLKFIASSTVPKPADPQPAVTAVSDVTPSLEDQIRDVKLKALEKHAADKQDDAWTRLYESCAREYPNHLPLQQARLHFLDRAHVRDSQLEAIVECAQALIEGIDETSLSSHFGLRSIDESNDSAAKRVREDRERTRVILVDALARLAHALAHLESLCVLAGHPVGAKGDRFTQAVGKLMQWEDISKATEADKYAHIHTAFLSSKGRLAALVTYADAAIVEVTDPELEKSLYSLKKSVIAEQLKWTHISGHDSLWECINHPSSFALF